MCHVAFFDDRDLSTVAWDFNGRSDYAAFVNASVPAAGLSTGADGVKSSDERRIFGGLANTVYDTCYHQPCDTLDNLNADVWLQMAQAMTFAAQSLIGVANLATWLYL